MNNLTAGSLHQPYLLPAPFLPSTKPCATVQAARELPCSAAVFYILPRVRASYLAGRLHGYDFCRTLTQGIKIPVQLCASRNLALPPSYSHARAHTHTTVLICFAALRRLYILLTKTLASRLMQSKKPLKKLKHRQNQALAKYSEAVRANLDRLQRLKFKAIVVIEIHARDVIDTMYRASKLSLILSSYWSIDNNDFSYSLLCFTYI